MMYCAVCSDALLERTIEGREVLLCSICGAVFVQTAPNKYWYAGTMHGSRYLKELLAFIDNKEATQ